MISAVLVRFWVDGRSRRVVVVAAAHGKGMYVFHHTFHFSFR
eukprot:COSAG02_NODE_20046_length_850_cov_1.560586_2_plen_41_part_01